MGIHYQKQSARLTDIVSGEEAEELLAWLQKSSRNKLNLKACTHLHAANLQVLMAARPAISQWPDEQNLKSWLESALGGH
jgi:hypothetical protein